MWIEPWEPRERSSSVHNSVFSSVSLGGSILSDEETFSTSGTVGIDITLDDLNEESWQGLSPRPETPFVGREPGGFPYKRLEP